MTTETNITVSKTMTTENTTPIWVNNEQYWLNRQAFIKEFRMVIQAIDGGYMPFIV